MPYGQAYEASIMDPEGRSVLLERVHERKAALSNA